MAALTDFLENELLDHVLNNLAYTSPTTVHVALFTTATTDAGGGTEVSGGAYARQALSVAVAASGATANDADVAFPVATANWGTISHVAIFDAATVGNMLLHGALTTAKTIDSGDQFKLPSGDLDVTLA